MHELFLLPVPLVEEADIVLQVLYENRREETVHKKVQKGKMTVTSHLKPLLSPCQSALDVFEGLGEQLQPESHQISTTMHWY